MWKSNRINKAELLFGVTFKEPSAKLFFLELISETVNEREDASISFFCSFLCWVATVLIARS
jgi:hypothetical protein